MAQSNFSDRCLGVWDGGSLLERVFVLLDLGVSMSVPVWQRADDAYRSAAGPDTWYVDLSAAPLYVPLQPPTTTPSAVPHATATRSPARRSRL